MPTRIKPQIGAIENTDEAKGHKTHKVAGKFWIEK